MFVKLVWSIQFKLKSFLYALYDNQIAFGPAPEKIDPLNCQENIQKKKVGQQAAIKNVQKLDVGTM